MPEALDSPEPGVSTPGLGPIQGPGIPEGCDNSASVSMPAQRSNERA